MLSAAGALPESVVRAFAIEPAPGSTYMDAEHVVILMQENRSFDHMLGTLQGVRGFNDPRAVRKAGGESVLVQRDAGGAAVAPWRLDIKDTKATWMGSLPHSRESQVDAWADGRHDGWLEAKRPHNKDYAHVPMTMGYYTREDLPFYYALADAFTVCDQHYCGAMTSTTPNRLLMWSGTVRDEQTVASKAFMRNGEVDFGEMTWTTYPERLKRAGISWKTYQNDISAAGGKTSEEDSWLSNFTDNALEFFAAYNVHLGPKYGLKMQEEMAAARKEMAKPGVSAKRLVELKARLEKVTKEYERSKGKLSSLPEKVQDLHRRAFVSSTSAEAQRLESITFEENGSRQPMMVPKGDVLEQFRKDVHEGTLPTVSWLVAPENFSDHPSAPWYGAWYVSEVMDILTKNPEVWKKTIFILTYDENDGYFDHAPSFVAADPTRAETGAATTGIDTGIEYAPREGELAFGVDGAQARQAPIGLGFRVPMIVASPWTRGGWVNSEVFDHTSTLRFLEGFLEGKYGKKVVETNISDWRRAICGDMTSIFRAGEKDDHGLHFLERDAFVGSIQRAKHKALPTGYSQDAARMPRQEPGVRRACAVPYEMYADGRVPRGEKRFVLTMRAGREVFGARAAGVPLNVYRYGTSVTAATFVMAAGGGLERSFPLHADGRYDIAVHGPNGFFREFKGSATDPALDVACDYERGASGSLTGRIALRMTDVGATRVYTVHVVDNAYKGRTVTKKIERTGLVVLDLTKQHGWYDVSVQVEGFDMVKRFAGHVETGRPSFTDPLMGGVVA